MILIVPDAVPTAHAAATSGLPWDVIVVIFLLVAVVAVIGAAWWRDRRGMSFKPRLPRMPLEVRPPKKDGFTLFEIIVVIAILAALAATAYPIYGKIHEKAVKSQEDGVVGGVRSGIKTYAAESDVRHRIPRFPETLDAAGPGSASRANPFYTTVLQHAVEDDWSKIGLVYRGPTTTEYEYDPALGTFNPASHPSGYVYGWSMDEGSGTGVGEGAFAGVIAGATWVEGLVGDALRFDGDRGHVHVPDSDAVELTDAGTVQSWINFDEMTPYAGIIHKGDAGNFSDETYTLQLWNNNHMMLGLTDASGNLHTVESTTVFEPGQWYHVSGTWDATGMHMYVNGVLENTTSGAVVARTSDGGVNIGSQTVTDYNGSWRNLPTQGVIDEAQIYGRALTAEEIQQYVSSIAH